MKTTSLQHSFVDAIPDQLEDGIIYVSFEHATVLHKCCCGCGEEVVTPLSPSDWQLTFNGKSISLFPSIGNWSYACRSHYWIKKNQVHWAEDWDLERISLSRKQDALTRTQYYDEQGSESTARDESLERPYDENILPDKSLWERLTLWFAGK
tara:strand:+ start:90 stop:545 length:456 start_codon:yes stop_codon:yes gene_type:complete